MKVKKTTSKTETTEIELDWRSIVDMLKRGGFIPQSANTLSVFVKIPGGGDYSNMDLDISEDVPVVVRFVVESCE